MHYHTLNMEQYSRKGQFDYFRNMAYPYVGMTVNLDITRFVADCKANGRPFFLTVLYAVTRTANAIPEFRQRIQDDQIIEFDHCVPSYTLATESGAYCYCTADERLPFPQYLTDARRRQEAAQNAPDLNDGGDAAQLYFISTLPWVSYTALVQPVPSPADSNPRITWGKYYTAEGRLLMPVSVLVHHALLDGAHIAGYCNDLQQCLNDTAWMR